MENKRKDFPEWQVQEAYLRQDGVCAKCGCSLKDGFHRHHLDGNPANNDPDNLQLLCPECHYATFHKKEYEEHKQIERDLMRVLHEAIHKAVEKELSGAILERIILASSRVLSLSRREKGLSKPVETLPNLHAEREYIQLYDWVRGFKEGMKYAIQYIIPESKQEEKEEPATKVMYAFHYGWAPCGGICEQTNKSSDNRQQRSKHVPKDKRTD